MYARAPDVTTNKLAMSLLSRIFLLYLCTGTACAAVVVNFVVVNVGTIGEPVVVQRLSNSCFLHSHAHCNGTFLDNGALKPAHNGEIGQFYTPHTTCDWKINRIVVFCVNQLNSGVSISQWPRESTNCPEVTVVSSRPREQECDYWQVVVSGNAIAWIIDDGTQSVTPWDVTKVTATITMQNADSHRSLWIVPTEPSCRPVAFKPTPTEVCERDTYSAQSWEPDTKIWMTIVWILVLSFYFMGVVHALWDQFPRVGIMTQAILLSLQLPLQFHSSFSSYVVSTAVAFVLPVVYIMGVLLRTVTRSRKHFRLLHHQTLEGIGLLTIFIFVHAVVFVLATW
jgi:hypothetical protein